MRKGSLAPREERKEQDSREVVFGNDAANEVANYACRLNAKDWSVPEIPFDLVFEQKYLAFWAWKGTLQDRRAALRVALQCPHSDIGVLFGAWREALFTRRERREAPHPRRTNLNDFVMRDGSSEGMAGDMLVSAAD